MEQKQTSSFLTKDGDKVATMEAPTICYAQDTMAFQQLPAVLQPLCHK